jgi:hypothetical protein
VGAVSVLGTGSITVHSDAVSLTLAVDDLKTDLAIKGSSITGSAFLFGAPFGINSLPDIGFIDRIHR